MNSINVRIAGVVLMTALLGQVNVNAQDSEPNKWAPEHISIDGQATEWPKPLQFYNNDTKLFYTIANNKDTLFMIVSSPDQASQRRILRSGLSVSINATGKKKGGAMITFPLVGEIMGAPDVPKESRQKLADEWKRQALANVKEIKVEGLTGVTDGNIPANNSYGIRTSAAFDAAGNLVCEMAVPLALAGIPAGYDKPVAYRFRVNSVSATERREFEKALREKQAKASKDGGAPAMPDEETRANMVLFFSSEFWTKQTLAAHP
ncbi:hypothetical protein [Chitinophaga qingshengii]|uniref:Uncharacterized protein n=1 Tax=Chitinophaga qingshengii TaxID=1569794 RepID=A0ABR7TGX2_9BACT|nr:hypothetical protein [Chitinophaga qingshengii]MBC9928737.1 hypothetical protein [Chitinophaga qingshengii]